MTGEAEEQRAHFNKGRNMYGQYLPKCFSDEEIFFLFNRYWQNTEWEDLTKKRIEYYLKNYSKIKIPDDINTPKIGWKYFRRVKLELLKQNDKAWIKQKEFAKECRDQGLSYIVPESTIRPPEQIECNRQGEGSPIKPIAPKKINLIGDTASN